MDLHEAFLQSIAESLYDDAPRLIYADWLEDHGASEPARELADFIRIQCELESMRDQYEIARAAELHRLEAELLRKHQREWLGPGLEGWQDWREDGASVEFRRGFVDTILMPARTFLSLGAATRQFHPTIRQVVLYRVNGYGEALARCAALDGVAELTLAGWYSDADAEAIARSPYLTRLQVLELWLGRRQGLTDPRLCRIMAGSRAWPGLRELVLLNPNDEKVNSRKRMVKVANTVAGCKVAVYRRGWPELYPFAADFWYTFPGHLRDGRMAMANEDYSTVPPTFNVLTFDKKGNQAKDVLTVAFPEDLLGIPPDECYKHKDRMQQHLVEAIGFRPGFIRVRDCRFPGDKSGYDSPCWEVYSMQGDDDLFGVPDPENPTPWQEYPCGFAGQLDRRRRSHEYVFGWDRYADKCGRVHST